MRFRKLRIGWSVFCGLATVLLIVLWVRSYIKNDRITLGFVPGPGYTFDSINGELSLARAKRIAGGMPQGWSAWTYPSDPSEYPRAWYAYPSTEILGFRFGKFFFAMPHWFPAVVAVTAAAVPWLRWRFTLSTLLIATTLVAVVLGLIVWAAKS
jgi:hypothetical protein